MYLYMYTLICITNCRKLYNGDVCGEENHVYMYIYSPICVTTGL